MNFVKICVLIIGLTLSLAGASPANSNYSKNSYVQTHASGGSSRTQRTSAGGGNRNYYRGSGRSTGRTRTTYSRGSTSNTRYTSTRTTRTQFVTRSGRSSSKNSKGLSY